ncbi:MAG TPA: DUF3566 domain-containing protein [Mycolicibacillus parakoreensis]|uniref:DUF3566 domain-containing protein n=1 Tax=Mycolicibacillus parakoreensis TaxID=1069221 RepID=A0ABY3TYS1_9MYCO|nr:DUF3566 domain-containing protein [Mycolicibacillus parakoreensis]ULN52835.1 DUF3566 domain-containing protein [Mycolicibacillus parakoreensis]HLR98374.1 DUF3566 domain-containing protein [Mycolicibacillus parakoreensis]
MTSPNQPEQSGPAADTAASPPPDGPAAPARSAPSGEVPPPWQRGVAKPRPAGAAPGPAPAKPAGAPTVKPAEVTRVEPAPAVAESYASELPDLSRATRTGQHKTPGRPTEAPAPAAGAARTGRTGTAVQVSRHSGPLRASMQLRRVDPWTTLKASLILSVALFFVWMIAVAFLYLILGAMGVWSKLNSNVGDLLHQTNVGAGGDIISASTIFGGATLIGLVNIVLLTAMAALGAFIYNLTADLVGGIEVTLADRE